MKILVTLKPVEDVQLKPEETNGQIRFSSEKVMNAWDEHALEAALQIKEKNNAEVTVLTIDSKGEESILRKGLAMGADKAILLNYDNENLESRGLAFLVQKIWKRENFDLVIMGKQAQDYDSGTACHFFSVAEKIPCIDNLDKIEIQENTLEVSRISSSGNQKIGIELPAILTVSDSINKPRLAGPRNLIMARKKPMEKIEISDLDIQDNSEFIFGNDYDSEFSLYGGEKTCRIFTGKPEQSVSEFCETLLKKA